MLNYSVVMAVRNGEKFIIESLESIFSQTYKAKTIFVVDDFSTDMTPNILNSYKEKITILKNGKKQGQVGALMTGLEKVSTSLVSFLDADDIWHLQKQEQQIKTMMNCGSSVVTSGVSEFFSDSKIGRIQRREILNTKLFTASTFKKELFDSIPLKMDSGPNTWQYDWWNLANQSKLKVCSTQTIHLYRRIHAWNVLKSKNPERDQELINYFRNKLSLESQSNDFK